MLTLRNFYARVYCLAQMAAFPTKRPGPDGGWPDDDCFILSKD
jgi:hypothetical protein